MPIRLNKFLASRLGISRRAADDLIARGAITVNDSTPILGTRIDKSDKVCYNGSIIPFAVQYTYLALHKPIGYVCSRRRQGSAPTIYELLPPEYQSLKTVGRLDRDSSGLILLTNDGDFAYRFTHPRFGKVKLYQVTLSHPLAPLHQQLISDYGIELGDGPSQLGLTQLQDRRHWQVTMHEGRNRQIRRTFAALGYHVTALHRTQFGPYHLHNLPPAHFTPVTLASCQ